MSKYSDLLKDPRWQQKRLSILNRDDWKCTFCGSGENQLQVHHIIYLWHRKPWEYPNELLCTACSDCHNEIHVPMGEFPDLTNLN